MLGTAIILIQFINLLLIQTKANCHFPYFGDILRMNFFVSVECEECGQSFMTDSQLKSHEQETHGNYFDESGKR